jgi:hypothetical protein
MLLLLLLLLLLGDSVVVSRQIAGVGFGQLNPSQLVQKGGILNKKKMVGFGKNQSDVVS